MLLRVPKWAAFGMLVTASVLQAAQIDTDQELPSLDLLEYLGSLVDSEEGLIGPEFFAEDKTTEDGRILDGTTPTSETSDEGEH